MANTSNRINVENDSIGHFSYSVIFRFLFLLITILAPRLLLLSHTPTQVLLETAATLLCLLYLCRIFIFHIYFAQLSIYLFPSKWTVVPKLVSRVNSSLVWSFALLACSVLLVSPHDNDNYNEFNYIIVISVNCFPSTDTGNAKTYTLSTQKVNIIEYNMQTAITFTFYLFFCFLFTMWYGI